MKVEIYGAEWCGACKNAVQLCDDRGVNYQYFEIDNSDNLRSLQERLKATVKSVPQIFVDGQHLPKGLSQLTTMIG